MMDIDSIVSVEIVEVTCVVFPDGFTYWHRRDLGHTRKAIKLWKSKNKWSKDVLATMGAVNLFMPEDKFNAIPAVDFIP